VCSGGAHRCKYLLGAVFCVPSAPARQSEQALRCGAKPRILAAAACAQTRSKAAEKKTSKLSLCITQAGGFSAAARCAAADCASRASLSPSVIGGRTAARCASLRRQHANILHAHACAITALPRTSTRHSAHARKPRRAAGRAAFLHHLLTATCCGYRRRITRAVRLLILRRVAAGASKTSARVKGGSMAAPTAPSAAAHHRPSTSRGGTNAVCALRRDGKRQRAGRTPRGIV